MYGRPEEVVIMWEFILRRLQNRMVKLKRCFLATHSSRWLNASRAKVSVSISRHSSCSRYHWSLLRHVDEPNTTLIHHRSRSEDLPSWSVSRSGAPWVLLLWQSSRADLWRNRKVVRFPPRRELEHREDHHYYNTYKTIWARCSSPEHSQPVWRLQFVCFLRAFKLFVPKVGTFNIILVCSQLST